MKTLIMIILLVSTQALAFRPDYAAPEKIQADGNVLKITGGFANPLVVDWNGDGLKDLIVGEKGPQPDDNGRLRYYRNYGSNSNPVFRSSVFMEAGGKVIKFYAD